MASVPADFADLCGAPHFAHLVTVNRDGSPQTSPIWIAADDVEADGSVSSIWFSTGKGYRKSLNMAREPRVSLTIHDNANPYRTLEIVGTAAMTPTTVWDDTDAMSQTYLGRDYPYKTDNREGYRVTVSVERVVTHGEFEPPPSRPLPEAGGDLLNPPHFAHVATVSRDGQPRSSVVWHRRSTASDAGADDIELWTGTQTVKTLHLRRNPAVAVSIHDEADPYRYVELRGQAEIVEVDNHGLLDELTPLYWQLDRYPAEEQMSGVIIRVKTERRLPEPA